MPKRIYEQLLEILEGSEGKVVTPKEIKLELNKRFKRNPSSVLLSDYCYNRINKGISFDKHLFENLGRGQYKYLGENYKYSGSIYHKPSAEKKDKKSGEWRNGKKTMFTSPNS